MTENEYPIRVPVIDRTGDTEKVIGEAEIDADGSTMLNITDADYADRLQPFAYSLFVDDESHIIRGED